MEQVTMNKTLSKHLAAIRSGEVTRSHIIGIRKAVNNSQRWAQGWSVPAYVTGEYARDVGLVLQALEDHRPRVTGELHDSGLAILRNPRYRSRWTPSQAAIIAELDHFKAVGFDYIGSRGQWSVPVYRAVGFSGCGFIFRNVPWQSGGDGPEVLSWWQ